ncbi:MAG: GerMN domain-containing protein [Armatimonadota bacterium]|nr:GerMN domain-containing protein [Armatimonadota bacterium]MDR7464541.1 GerMN domain-containing protein [Armatimonadota bacterium]MDR7468998.1 GerMN domain-containing protein [Armatimonadota bacterium]MDR7474045.1 GerMN domain-containing protein [Armatimonadota bacterium]MDR7538039.1 GerMN domain-containing protein [Armatimonadota bacterium]
MNPDRNRSVRNRWLLAFLLVIGPALVWYLFIRPVPTEVAVYFTRVQDGEATLAPVTRLVLARSLESKLRGAYTALLAGPSEGERALGLTTEIPPGTVLRGLAVAGDVAVVDLSAEVERGGGSSSVQGRVWQLVYTGTQFSGVSRVRILIEGQPRKALGGEGFIIEDPLPRPPAIPRF